MEEVKKLSLRELKRKYRAGVIFVTFLVALGATVFLICQFTQWAATR